MSADEKRLQKLKSDYKEYFKNYSLLLTLGLIWIGAAYAGTFEIQLSILILFAGVTLFKPILSITTILLRAPKIHKDESLKILTKLIIIGILFGLIAGFFPFQENLNLFFPAFSVIFGFIFAAIAVTSGLKIYGVLSLVLITGGVYIGYNYPEDFTIGGFFSGYCMATLGILSGIFGKKARITFRFLKRKLNNKIPAITPKATIVKRSVKPKENSVL